MKFFAVSLLALGASAAPATFTQHHHTVGTSIHGVHSAHKQVFAAPLSTSTTFNKVFAAPQLTQTYSKVAIAEPISYVNKVQTVGYVQPSTFVQPTTYVKPATFVQPAVNYVQPAVNYIQPAVNYIQPAGYVQPTTTFVQKPAVQYVSPAVTATQYQTAEVQLPVHQVDRTVQYLDVPHIEKPAAIQTIRIAPSTNPLHIHFDSQGSQLSTSQSHYKAAPAEPKYEEAHDDASHLALNIKKDVHQTITENIQPVRKIEQVVNPLIESVNTVVSRATHERAQYVAPQVHHHQQTVVKAVEVPKTYVQSVQAVENVVPTTQFVETVAAPIQQQGFIKPFFQTNYAVKPQTVYTQGADVIGQTYVKPVETIQKVQTAYAYQPETTYAVQPETTYAVQPDTTYVQGQAVEYVSKPVTTIVEPVAQFSTKKVVTEKVEY